MLAWAKRRPSRARGGRGRASRRGRDTLSGRPLEPVGPARATAHAAAQAKEAERVAEHIQRVEARWLPVRPTPRRPSATRKAGAGTARPHAAPLALSCSPLSCGSSPHPKKRTRRGRPPKAEAPGGGPLSPPGAPRGPAPLWTRSGNGAKFTAAYHTPLNVGYRGLADLRHFRLCVTGTDSPRGEMQACQGTWSRTSLNTDPSAPRGARGRKTLSSLMPQNRPFRSKRPAAPGKSRNATEPIWRGGSTNSLLFVQNRSTAPTYQVQNTNIPAIQPVRRRAHRPQRVVSCGHFVWPPLARGHTASTLRPQGCVPAPDTPPGGVLPRAGSNQSPFQRRQGEYGALHRLLTSARPPGSTAGTRPETPSDYGPAGPGGSRVRCLALPPRAQRNPPGTPPVESAPSRTRRAAGPSCPAVAGRAGPGHAPAAARPGRSCPSSRGTMTRSAIKAEPSPVPSPRNSIRPPS